LRRTVAHTNADTYSDAFADTVTDDDSEPDAHRHSGTDASCYSHRNADAKSDLAIIYCV